MQQQPSPALVANVRHQQQIQQQQAQVAAMQVSCPFPGNPLAFSTPPPPPPPPPFQDGQLCSCPARAGASGHHGTHGYILPMPPPAKLGSPPQYHPGDVLQTLQQLGNSSHSAGSSLKLSHMGATSLEQLFQQNLGSVLDSSYSFGSGDSGHPEHALCSVAELWHWHP